MLARIRKSVEENDEGFTLIELLVVIIIIGILAAIAIPVFLNQRKKGYDAASKSDLRNLATSEETYLTDSTTGYGALTALTDFHKTTGDQVGVAVDGSNGYCSIALSKSGNYFAYDSESGGLVGTTFTSVPTKTTLNAAGATGACQAVASLPTPS